MVKFLIIRFSSIGDIVLTTPVLRALKLHVEDSEIHYLTKPAYKNMLQANPYISKIHTLNDIQTITTTALKKEEYDYIIDLQNNMRSLDIKRSLKRMDFTVNKINIKKWLYVNFKIDKMPHLHIVDRYMKTIEVFDIPSEESGLDFFLDESDEISISSLPEGFSKGFIVLVIGAKHSTKKLPPKKLAEIASGINHPIILVGGPEDKEDGNKLSEKLKDKEIFNACGLWTINQSASIIKQANVVISHDTGMMHIAAAFRKKILTIWGNTTPRFGMYAYRPDPQSKNFEVENLSCRPCSKLGKKECPKKHFNCMQNQDSEKISAAANQLF